MFVIWIFTHADGSCRCSILTVVCLSVDMIPQKLMLQGSPNLTCKFSTMRRGNPLIFGVKCKVTSHKRPVPAMGICTLVSAGFFYLLLWLIWPCYNFDSIIKVKNCSKFNPKFQFFLAESLDIGKHIAFCHRVWLDTVVDAVAGLKKRLQFWSLKRSHGL